MAIGKGKLRINVIPFRNISAIKMQITSARSEDVGKVLKKLLEMCDAASSGYGGGIIANEININANYPELKENEKCGVSLCLMFNGKKTRKRFIEDIVKPLINSSHDEV